MCKNWNLPKAVVIPQRHQPITQLDHLLKLQLVIFRVLIYRKIGVRNWSMST